MTVRELIAELSEQDLDATVEVEWNFVVDEFATRIRVVAYHTADGAPFVQIVGE